MLHCDHYSETHLKHTFSCTGVPFPTDRASQRMLEAVLQDAIDQARSRDATIATRIQFAGYQITALDQRVRLAFGDES